jgi:hypothetical protein
MTPEELESLKLHVAGATVRHRSPFDHLVSFKNELELSQDFINKWINPFYMHIGSVDDEWVSQLRSIKKEITSDIIQRSLGDFNWRTRQTGAFFSAITERIEFIDTIGVHLLKSEVCYAGGVYCKVFASFNTAQCVDYLNLYLDYYLTKPDLWFDQRDAMEAVMYLDKINGTNHLDNHINNWTEFIKNKPHWSKQIEVGRLEKQIALINIVRQSGR